MNRYTTSARLADEAADLTVAALGAAALGAGLMYLLDPVAGGRRRSVIRGKMSSATHRAGEAFQKTGEYMAGEMRGLVAETRAHFRDEPVTDRQICARVRSAIGRAVSHPRAIEVTANNGVVGLSGHVLADELDGLLATVRRVRDVERVENILQVHDDAENIPELQGGRQRRRGSQWSIGFMQENWPPSTRACAALTGATLGVWGAARHDVIGVPMSLLGLGLIARAATNVSFSRLFGFGGGRRAVDVQKTIKVAAPLDAVFAFFASYENFPCFMSNVVEVRDNGYGRSHWVVKGPAGTIVRWDADLTRFVPNETIAWKSVEGSTVANAGVIRFDTNPDGTTRVDIKLSYNPPGGAVGHLIAKAFGADARSEMDQDLLRAKTLLETGQPAHDTPAGKA